MHRGKVDPEVSELPRGNELSRDHVNRLLEMIEGLKNTAFSVKDKEADYFTTV